MINRVHDLGYSTDYCICCCKFRKDRPGSIGQRISHERDNFYGFFVQKYVVYDNKQKGYFFCLLPLKRSGVRKESVVETAAVFPNGL